MGIGEILLLGLALSADAFSVTLSNMFVYHRTSRARLMLMPLMFGLFQGLLPLLGYFLGGVAGAFIEQYAGIITLVVLGVIGGNMVREGVESLRHPEQAQATDKQLTFGIVFAQAIATAIDAFAVGVSLRAEGAPILFASVVIALTTFACCVVALLIGRKAGELLGDKAEIVGGVVLIGIGVKAFLGL